MLKKATPGGMLGQGASRPQTRACLRQGVGEGAASPSRAVGATAVSTGGAPHDKRGMAHRQRGPALPEGQGRHAPPQGGVG